jgi:hypothetical protein
MGKRKIKQSRYTPWWHLGERRHSSYSFTTSTLDGVSSQRHAPAALYPRGKDPRYPLYRRLGGPQSRSGHRGYRNNSLSLPGIEPRSLSRPARSRTLYWLRYPGSTLIISWAVTQQTVLKDSCDSTTLERCLLAHYCARKLRSFC